MSALILGFGIGLIAGLMLAIPITRWSVSNLRENARRAIRLRNQAEEVVENVTIEIRKLHKENGRLRNELFETRNELSDARAYNPREQFLRSPRSWKEN